MTTTGDASSWPFLKRYAGEHLRRVALPLGGIGTGTISLGGRGDLRDWEIMNAPAKGYTPVLRNVRNTGTFFALSVLHGGRRVTRCLEGPIDSSEYEAAAGCETPNACFPRFREATFRTAYPLGMVELRDGDVPLEVELRAMNPLVPGDTEASSLPCAMLSFYLRNPNAEPVEASLCGTVLHAVGRDGRPKTADGDRPAARVGPERDVNRQVDCVHGTRLHLSSGIEDPGDVAYGDLCLTAGGGTDAGVRTAWAALSWGDSVLDFWDEFSTTGAITPRDGGPPFNRLGSLARKLTLQPGESGEIRFLLTWRFPNRKGWADTVVGNHYAERFPTSIAAADYVLEHGEELTRRTVDFVRAFCASPLPEAVKEAALFNASTLRTETCFRTPDGRFFGWEGCHDTGGCCAGTCTHVWNYEQTTAFLFADLSRGLREVEFLHAVNDEGKMRFRALLPLARNAEPGGQAAADGQMGCIMKMYRDWKLSGDDAWLLSLWPKVKAALAFAWVPGGWDADRDGVMEGCQHNTMDVDYYGPNPQMQGWYLGALKAAACMAARVAEAGGDPGAAAFAETCEDLYRRGRAWTDRELFNGAYYEHRVKVPRAVHPDTTNRHGLDADGRPVLQLGKGCLIDQLVGQYMAHVCGLGHILDPEHVKTALRSVLKYNLRHGFHDHFNHMRNYVFADETAVLMATYPMGERPTRPFPYYNEVMTGFEHQLAAHLVYEGMEAEGVELAGHIRARYDGRKRNPFNEAECGHHYARAMAAWAELLACSGFRYDGTSGTLAVTDQPAPMFFSFGRGWGTWKTEEREGAVTVVVELREGELPLRRVVIDGRDVPFVLEGNG